MNDPQHGKIQAFATNHGYQINLILNGQTLAVPSPVRLHLGPVSRLSNWLEYGYQKVEKDHKVVLGTCKVELESGVLEFHDEYVEEDGNTRIKRSINVLSSDRSHPEQAFLTDFSLLLPGGMRNKYWFAPGLWYLENEFVPFFSFGSKGLLEEGKLHYCYFREDRLSAPLFSVYDRETGWSFVLFHSNPVGTTVCADDEVTPLVDPRLNFGSFGLEFGEQLRMGFWFPGSEGDIAYPARDWSYSVMWNNQLAEAKKGTRQSEKYGRSLSLPGIFRFHPIQEGFHQEYELQLQAFSSPSYPEMLKRTWRSAWKSLNPQVVSAPLDKIEQVSIDLLSSLVREEKNVPGLPFSMDIFNDRLGRPVYALGFVGRNILSSFYLFRAGYQRGATHLFDQGRKIIDFWVNNSGVGRLHTRFNFQEGVWQDHGEENGRLQAYLRPLAEGHLDCLKAWQLEKDHNLDQKLWFNWAVDFGNWLLASQNPDGSFYRMYFSDGEPAWKVSSDCYTVIPFLIALERTTGDERYLQSAVRVADYIWQNFHSQGHFIGGTIDNPSCYDKEAAVISFEAYLALYHRTRLHKWLEAACLAADFTETWIYIWDIPLPEDGDERHWSKRASTVGLQLVCTGHSLSDMFLAFNCGDYADLAQLTGDDHYQQVADLLLHNTKQLIWLDNPRVARPGYQQEHWTFSIGRGAGLHSEWLPWVTVSHLVGMEKYMAIQKEKS